MMILKLNPYPCTLKLKIVKSLPEDVCGLVEYNKGNITMKLKIDDWQSYFVHEACHVVQAIEKYIEQKLGEEEEAYMLQFITDNIRKYVITKGIDKNGRRKNKTTKDLQQKLRSTSSLQEIYKGRSRKSN